MTDEIKYTNKNDSNRIDIVSDPLRIIIIDEPILVIWGISGTRYQYSSPFAIIEYMNQDLLNRFNAASKYLGTKSLNESLEYIEILFQLFPKGEFTISKKEVNSSSENGRFKDFQLIYPTKVDRSKEEDLVQSYNQWLDTQERESSDLIDKTSDFIVYLTGNIIALHKKTDEFHSEVTQYENQIRNENYPYCIILSHFFEGEDSDTFFSLESTSKLQAYKNLNINPRIIEIKKIGDSTIIDQEQVLEFFHRRLYEWQSKSIFDWFSKDENFITKISNNNHPFEKYIKNGFVKEYWTNQQLKTHGHYVKHKADGIIESYYKNGQLKSKELYQDGNKIRPIEGYYRSGKKQFEYLLLDNSNKGKMINFHENGRISFETLYNNGKFSVADISDGESYVIYHDNGKVEFKGYYKDGKRYRYQKFNERGKLIEDKSNNSA